LAGQFARVSLGEKTADQKALEDFLRRQSWEQGNMDYLGRDSFSNIWSKINETLGNVPEVSVETVAVTTSAPPEVVHTEEPKPLKSALKKTSTTIPPVSFELDNSDLATKQLEKLDLSKDILKELKTPDTPTVTAPTPPTTPATQAQESIKSVPVESVKETIKSDDIIKESQQPAELESTKIESTELVKELPTSEGCTLKSVEQELPKPELVEPVKETPTADAITESKELSKLEENSPKSDSPVPKSDESVKTISQPSETAQSSQISVDNSTPLVSNDPPVAPKRTNKGSPSVSKNTKSSEKK